MHTLSTVFLFAAVLALTWSQLRLRKTIGTRFLNANRTLEGINIRVEGIDNGNNLVRRLRQADIVELHSRLDTQRQRFKDVEQELEVRKLVSQCHNNRLDLLEENVDKIDAATLATFQMLDGDMELIDENFRKVEDAVNELNSRSDATNGRLAGLEFPNPDTLCGVGESLETVKPARRRKRK